MWQRHQKDVWSKLACSHLWEQLCEWNLNGHLFDTRAHVAALERVVEREKAEPLAWSFTSLGSSTPQVRQQLGTAADRNHVNKRLCEREEIIASGEKETWVQKYGDYLSAQNWIEFLPGI